MIRFAGPVGVLLALLAPFPAAAQPASFHRVREVRAAASEGSRAITLGPHAGQHVRLGASVRPSRVSVFSVDNRNERFMLEVRHASRPCGTLALRLGTAWLVGGSYGGDDSGCSATLELDRASAERAAASLSIPLHVRREVGRRVQGTFEAPSRIRAGEPAVVRLRLSNPADAPPVHRYAGGRQRGPRNNRFHFTVRRDGVLLAEREGMDFGGLGGPVRLSPGSEAVLEEQVGRWADVSVPGRYTVECRYETTLMPDGVDLLAAHTTSRVWERRFTGTVRFTVR